MKANEMILNVILNSINKKYHDNEWQFYLVEEPISFKRSSG